MPWLSSPSTWGDRVDDLACGQQAVLALRRGEILSMLGGAATLHHAAHWIGETLVQRRGELREGETYRASEAEIVTLVARAPTRVLRCR